MACALALATVAEVVAVHLLLSRWNTAVAWVATVAGISGLVWIVRDYRVVRRQPHVVSDDVVTIRRGLLWRSDIPMENIGTARVPTPEERTDPSAAVDLLLWLPAAPWVLIELETPATVRGPAGIRRRVTRLGVSVDDPAGFASAVNTRKQQHAHGPTAP